MTDINEIIHNIELLTRNLPAYISQTITGNGLNNYYECNYTEHNSYIYSSSNKIITTILEMHKINVMNFHLIFNETLELEQLKEAMAYAKEQYTEALATFPNYTYDTQYLMYTVYINSIADCMNIPGFKLIENKALDLCFQKARENANNINGAFPRDEELIINKFFISEDEHTIIRITNYLNNIKPKYNSELEYLQPYHFTYPEDHISLAVLPVLIPDFKAKLSSEELELLKIFADPYTFNTLATKNRLKAVFTTDFYITKFKYLQLEHIKQLFKDNVIQDFDARIRSKKSQLDNLVQQVLDLEQLLTRLNNEKFIAEYQTEELDEKLNYIFNHPYIKDITYAQNILYLKARAPLTMWDEDLARTLLKNMSNILANNGVTNVRLGKYIKFFFEEILINQKAIYYMANIIRIVPSTFNWAYDSHNSESNELLDLLKTVQAGYSPHIVHYNCQGTHKIEIGRAQESRDLIAFIEALLNPLKNWNLSDGAVMRAAIKHMFPILINNNIKCLEYEKEMYTIPELYDKLNEGNEGDEESD